MTTTYETKHEECTDFKYFCDNMKRCCAFCGQWFRFDESKKQWVRE